MITLIVYRDESYCRSMGHCVETYPSLFEHFYNINEVTLINTLAHYFSVNNRVEPQEYTYGFLVYEDGYLVYDTIDEDGIVGGVDVLNVKEKYLMIIEEAKFKAEELDIRAVEEEKQKKLKYKQEQEEKAKKYDLEELERLKKKYEKEVYDAR